MNTPKPTSDGPFEDPVGINLPASSRASAREHWSNFAAALRCSYARSNIILVANRDFETAEIAVKAPSRGIRAVDTPHERRAQHDQSLMNMGIEPFLVASSVN